MIYLPVLVMIISVPNSLNLSHSSLVSKKQSTWRSSSLLHFGLRNLGLSSFFFFFTGGSDVSGFESRLLDSSFLIDLVSSESLHCSTSTSSSLSKEESAFLGEERKTDFGLILGSEMACIVLVTFLKLFGVLSLFTKFKRHSQKLAILFH